MCWYWTQKSWGTSRMPMLINFPCVFASFLKVTERLRSKYLCQQKHWKMTAKKKKKKNRLACLDRAPFFLTGIRNIRDTVEFTSIIYT